MFGVEQLFKRVEQLIIFGGTGYKKKLQDKTCLMIL